MSINPGNLENNNTPSIATSKKGKKKNKKMLSGETSPLKNEQFRAAARIYGTSTSVWSTHDGLCCSGTWILTFPRIRLYSALWFHNLNTLNEILSHPGFIFWKNYSPFWLSSTLGKSDEPEGLCCLLALLKYQSSGQRTWEGGGLGTSPLLTVARPS